MKLRLAELSTRRIELELPVGDRLRTILIEGLTGVSGEVGHRAGATTLRPLAALEATIARIEWPLDGVELALASPATLTKLSVDAAIGPGDAGLHGRIDAESVVARGLSLGSADQRVAADARGRAIAIERTQVGGHAAGDEIDLADLQATLGVALVRAAHVRLERLRYDWSAAGSMFGGAGGALNGVSIAAPGIDVTATRVELPGGIRGDARAIALPDVVVPEVEIALADLTELLRRPARAEPAPDAPVEPRTTPDLDFLDRLDGHLEVDLTADLALPVLGSRRKTHHFRVPIAYGTINYKDLEGDLAGIEDAFIDLEVRGRQLAIERRIPFVPGSEKPLILFDLDPAELELAKRRLVRLASIATLRRPASTGDGGKSSVQLRELHFANVDLGLSFRPPVEGALDRAWNATGSLAARGELRFVPGKPQEPTRANLVADEVALGPLGFRIGNRRLEIARLTAARLEAEVDFEGFLPRGARIRVHGLAASGVRLLAAAPIV